MPLHEVQPLPVHVLAELEIQHPENEVRHVEIEHPRVLVRPVRPLSHGLVQPALLLQGRHARYLENQPAQFQIEGSGRAPHLDLLGPHDSIEWVCCRRVDEWETEMQVIRDGRGEVVLVPALG